MKNKRDNRAKFHEFAEKRVRKASNALKLVGNLGNKNLYESTEQERKEIKEFLRKALKDMEKNLDSDPKKDKQEFKLSGK
tara:strand:- start:5665 stop:5904 length:240 start_codon:yes stop_codon:yes gene_type:complete